MPRRRKNNELYIFSKVKKKTVENKRRNMEKVRDLIDQYSYVYVFHAQNYRNRFMKELKKEFEFSGRFFMGKVRPTMIALGRNEQNEYRDNLHFVSNALSKTAKGSNRGLFFTNDKSDKIIQFFKNYKAITFAKTGFVATKDYFVNKGELSQFVFSQECVLKKLGLPVILKDGKLILNQNYIVCQKGQPLKPEQCKLLELLNEPMAQFSITIHGYWTNKEYFECFNLKVNDNDNNEEKKSMDEDLDNETDKNNESKNNESGENENFLNAFVGDDDSSDEDIEDVD